MRLALYGNICNNFYAVARALRQNSGIDAHLFLDHHTHLQERPESEDARLRNGYPDWIHVGDYYDRPTRIWPGQSPLIKEFKEFDAVMLSGAGVRLASFISKPTVFFVTGGDLTVLPFPWIYRSRNPTVIQKLSAFYHALWYRRGIHSMTEIWVQPFECYAQALRRLRVDSAQIVPSYFPIMVDTNLFSPRDEVDRNDQDLDCLKNFDFIVFHPSRIMIDDHWAYKASGQWKRNDELVRGFADWIRTKKGVRAALVMIDRGELKPREKLKELVRSLGIEDYIVWLKPPRPEGFTRDELLKFYRVSDIVADDFGSGAFGSIVVEGASCAKPVFCYLDESIMKKIYPWHPIVSTETKLDISDQLENLYSNADLRKQIGEKSREWAIQFHSIDQINALYVEGCVKLFERLGHSIKSQAIV